QRGERLQVEQLDAAGLKQRGEVARAVVGRKNKRMQRWHLTGVERAPKLRGFSFFFRAVNFSALDSFAKPLLDLGQDSVTRLCVLLVLLIIIQSGWRLIAAKRQDQIRHRKTTP